MSASTSVPSRPSTAGIWLTLGVAVPVISATAAGLIAMHWSGSTGTQRVQSLVAAAAGLGLTWGALYATFAITHP